MYLSPPEASILGAKIKDLQLKPNVEAALSVLEEHYDKINPVKVQYEIVFSCGCVLTFQTLGHIVH
jgi:hypothetical protein